MFFTPRCSSLSSPPISRLRRQREQHREEGDPAEQNQDVLRRGDVSHRGASRGVGSASQVVQRLDSTASV